MKLNKNSSKVKIPTILPDTEVNYICTTMWSPEPETFFFAVSKVLS